MKNKDLLNSLNEILKEKDLNLSHFSSWNEVYLLETQDLDLILNLLANLLMEKGIDQDGEINKTGLWYESILDLVNREVIKRNDLKRKL